MSHMSRLRSPRRSLSNIIGSVILIAATIVGGFLVYNYFQRSLGAFMSMGNTVGLSASETQLSSGASAIYVKITNDEGYPITITGVHLLYPNGTTVNMSSVMISSNSNIIGYTIESGHSVAGVYVVKGYYTGVYVTYEANGVTYSTQPVSLS